MRPTLHLGLPSGTPDIRWVLSGPMQGFDAIRIVSQIVSVQCLHYLALALVLPPLLSIFAFNRQALNFQGGAASLSLLLDWREIAGYPITDGGRPWPWNGQRHEKIGQLEHEILTSGGLNTSDINDGDGIRYWWEWEAFIQRDNRHFVKVKSGDSIAWEGRKLGASSVREATVTTLLTQSGRDKTYEELGWWHALAQDRSRGWAIVLAWAAAGAIDVFLLSLLIRRPTHILDHAITLQVLHLALTWFYTRAFPTSLFYWLVMAAHTGACVVWAEALSIRREMRAGFRSGFEDGADGDGGEGGTGIRDEDRRALLNTNGTQRADRPTTHVLFEGDDDADDDDNGTDMAHLKDGKRNGQPHERIEMKRMD